MNKMQYICSKREFKNTDKILDKRPSIRYNTHVMRVSMPITDIITLRRIDRCDAISPRGGVNMALKANYETVMVISMKQGEDGIQALIEKFKALI